jgi:heat shock protein HtpX
MDNKKYTTLFENFLKKNRAYSVCSFIYFLFAVFWFGGFNLFMKINRWDDTHISELYTMFAIWVVLGIIYVTSILSVTSPVGESVMRFLNSIRRLETVREKDYLRPLFNEVLDKAKEKNPELADYNINIYVIDSMTVNACAMGLRTVAVTKGAIEAFKSKPDQLKAIIAHEISHILNADTFAKIYILIGNGIFSFCFLLVKLIWWIVGRIPALREPMQISSRALDVLIFVFSFPMYIVLAISDRKAERRADSYAVELGYGEDMVEALYLLEKMSLRGIEGLIEKMLASHPRVTSRIEALEVQLGIQEDERRRV